MTIYRLIRVIKIKPYIVDDTPVRDAILLANTVPYQTMFGGASKKFTMIAAEKMLVEIFGNRHLKIN